MYLDKTRIKRSFAAASLTYDSVAVLQRSVGKELHSSIDATKLSGTLLDLGCGTGFLTGIFRQGFTSGYPALSPFGLMQICSRQICAGIQNTGM